MLPMDALSFFLAHDATRNAIAGAGPHDRRRRRPAKRPERIRQRPVASPSTSHPAAAAPAR